MVKIWPRFGILQARGTPPVIASVACALFIVKQQPRLARFPGAPRQAWRVFLRLCFGYAFPLTSPCAPISASAQTAHVPVPPLMPCDWIA